MYRIDTLTGLVTIISTIVTTINTAVDGTIDNNVHNRHSHGTRQVDTTIANSIKI